MSLSEQPVYHKRFSLLFLPQQEKELRGRQIGSFRWAWPMED